MEPESRKLKTIIFCGGNGAKNIIETLGDSHLFEVCAIVNAYDDGKSTGNLRRTIPGFLGPSDVRKNMSYFIDSSDTSKRILKDLLEYRFPQKAENKKALQDLYNIIQQKSLSHTDLDIFIKKLKNEDLVKIRIFIKFFLDYIKKNTPEFNFDDCSFGNIILAGAFLKNGKDFNLSNKEVTEFLSLKGNVVNVTKGENLFLSALLKNGEFLPSEASIVERRINDEIEEIFLLENYLSTKEVKKIEKMPKGKKLQHLRNLEVTPLLGEEARKKIADAEVIVYSPGTQNSSLFPTYLTEGLAEAVASNKKAKKIFVTNIGEDNEIPDATVEDIIEKALFYINRKNKLKYSKEDFFDYYFVHSGDQRDPKYVKFLNRLNLKNVIHENFEQDFSGKHDGKKVVDKIMEIIYEGKANSKRVRKLSIIIPAYNEERYVLQLIDKLRALNLSDLGIIKEIIFVDAASTDNTPKLVSSLKDIKYVRMPVTLGKGDAVIKGIKAATGDVIVIQDADLEYNPEDIKDMLRVMLKHNFKAVYGSRTIKRGSRARALSILYGKRKEAYWSYYLGGQLLSFVTLLLYGEFITDTVTGYKMANAKLLKSFNLKSTGFELDHEITAKILKKKHEIFEVPVSYIPRTKEQGKKIKWKDGFIAIKTLFKFRFVD